MRRAFKLSPLILCGVFLIVGSVFGVSLDNVGSIASVATNKVADLMLLGRKSGFQSKGNALLVTHSVAAGGTRSLQKGLYADDYSIGRDLSSAGVLDDIDIVPKIGGSSLLGIIVILIVCWMVYRGCCHGSDSEESYPSNNPTGGDTELSNRRRQEERERKREEEGERREAESKHEFEEICEEFRLVTEGERRERAREEEAARRERNASSNETGWGFNCDPTWR